MEDVDALEVDDEEEAMEDDRRSITTNKLTQLALPEEDLPCNVSISSPPCHPFNSRGWNPHCIKAKHRGAKTMEWNQVPVVLLPSDAGTSASAEDIDLHLENNNSVLAIQDIWPEWITDLEHLFFLKRHLLGQAKQEWQSLLAKAQEQADSYACMACALQEQMALMRPDPKSSALKSTARIKLDFPVKPITPDDWLCVGNDSGVRLLFVDLKAPALTSYEAKAVKSILLAPKEEK